jgi:uncharacterized membrane protein (UPF0127 family)
MVGALRDPPSRGAAFVLSPAKQIHTIGMRAPIDVVFCDGRWTVVHLIRGMRPWRLSRLVLDARYAIELAAGAASHVSVGDTVTFG